MTAHVLLDPGSHRTYITQKLANKLELKWLQKEIIISVVTFGSTKPKQIESHLLEIELPLKDGTLFNLTANVIPEITGFIHRSPVCLGKTAFYGKTCHWPTLSLLKRKFLPLNYLLAFITTSN